MTNVALIKDGIVENVAYIEDGGTIQNNTYVRADGSSYDFGGGYDLVIVNDGVAVNIGYSYADGVFSAPPLTDEQKQALIDQAVFFNEQTKESLISSATNKIVPYQTKLLMGRTLTDAEKSIVNAWLDYIDALDAIDASISTSITWPSAPS